MIYPNLQFPKPSGRPFFYTNFVSTLDGKVSVKKDGYWPIGSTRDYEVMMELRAYADCLIHGKNLFSKFGKVTKESLKKESFKDLRKKLGKNPELPYLTATHDLKNLVKELQNKGYKKILVEGGPHLLGSFLKENLIDQVFLTLAPKIIGNEKSSTLTLVEGFLFPSEAIIDLSLLSIIRIEDELFLRYKVNTK